MDHARGSGMVIRVGTARPINLAMEGDIRMVVDQL
jgi:hypothetical protein